MPTYSPHTQTAEIAAVPASWLSHATPQPAGQMEQGRGQPEWSNSALMARAGPMGDGEWAEAMCGLGGVARLMPALQHTHAWMRGSIHLENMEATSEAWQGCPRSPRPQKLDRLACVRG